AISRSHPAMPPPRSEACRRRQSRERRDQRDRHVASLLRIKTRLSLRRRLRRLRQSKGLQGSEGSPRRVAPSNQNTFVIAKEACRLRQSKGEQGSDGSPRRFAPRDDRRGEKFIATITQRLGVGPSSRDDNRWGRSSWPAPRKLRLIPLSR